MNKLGLGTIGLAAVLLVGCGVDPGDTSSGGSGGDTGGGGAGGSGGGLQCPDDPADGPVPPECGIWVRLEGDDANDGSQDAPVATLTKAVALADKGPGRVYACNETWTEALVVPGHVSLHGGFDCEAGWAYVAAEDRRARLASPSPVGMMWVGEAVDPRPFVYDAHVTDFYVEAADAVEPGGSSIAVFVRGSVRPSFRRCELVAGDGADGLDGEPGDAGGPAAAGANGADGAGACSAPVSQGGTSPENACAQAISKGGAGGDGGLMTATSGGDGEPGSDPEAGKGGLGEQLAPACTNGAPGAPGAPGMNGLGGTLYKARLTVDGYVGAPGEDGETGAPGQGGGGGGATFGSVAVCGAANPGGAGGGAGGAGGCGGKGGRGGKPGGSSFGVAALATVSLYDTFIVTGHPGKGGNGGPPQSGAAGGLGGKGGAGAGSVKAACNGGNGGSGGLGGWGGGGAGGNSLCHVYPMGGEGMTGILKCHFEMGGEGGFGEAWNIGEGGMGLYGGSTPIQP